MPGISWNRITMQPPEMLLKFFSITGRYNIYHNPLDELSVITEKIEPTASQKAPAKILAATG